MSGCRAKGSGLKVEGTQEVLLRAHSLTPAIAPPPLPSCASAPPHLDPQVLSYAELIEPHPELKPSQDRVVYKEAIFTDIDTQIYVVTTYPSHHPDLIGPVSWSSAVARLLRSARRLTVVGPEYLGIDRLTLEPELLGHFAFAALLV